MKFTKKIFCIVLSLLMLLCTIPFGASAADEHAYLKFEAVGTQGTSNFHYEISGVEAGSPGVISIPSAHQGAPVTKIRKDAFKSLGTLTEVTIPSSVTAILGGAFASCLNLKKVTFEGNDVTLSASVFEGCTALSTVKLPAKLKKIADFTFNGCYSLESCDIPSTVTSIGTKAFNSCRKLKSISIPAATTVIGEEAFADCTSVTSFSVASGNTAYKSESSVLFTKDGKKLINYPAAHRQTYYAIPAGVETVGTMAFAKSAKLTSITFSDSVRSIEPYAFSEASALSSVELGKVQTISTMAFARCTSLKEITIPGTVKNFGSAFVASGLESVTFASGVTTVSNGAFDSCASLKSVSFPASLTKIEAGAFKNCSALTQLLIPSTVKTIEKNAFVGIANKINLLVYAQTPAYNYARTYSIKYTIMNDNTKVTISGGEADMKLAYYKTAKLSASADGLRIKWSSSDPKIVKVDASGNLKAVGKGTAVITASVEGAESINSSVNVTVTFTLWQRIVYFFRTLFGIEG